MIHDQPSDVYVPFHPELAIMAGKQPFASWSPMYQLEGNYGGGDVRTAGRVKTEFLRAMERQQFSMLILDQEPNWIWDRNARPQQPAHLPGCRRLLACHRQQTRPETMYP
jgi:hypothetical protein